MKRSLLLSIAASLSLYAFADFTEAGYYRIHNFKTARYASVIDNRGRIDYMNTTADLQAIKLQKNFDEVCSDPASVLYVSKEGNDYQIEAQGTGLYQIIKHYLKLKTAGSHDGVQLYNAYGEMSGAVKYIGDGNFFLSSDLGDMVTHAKGDYIKWFITPVSPETENFFGIQPTVEVDGKYYTTMLASFPYSPYSDGIKSYYVKNHYNGMILLEEVKGIVPANTPVLIECSTENPATNRLTIGGNGTKIADNKLKGVYFNCEIYGHENQVAYDKETMRVLGTCADGTLGFIKDETLDFIPANKCYIRVDKGSPDEYKMVSASEFEADVEELSIDASTSPADVYNIHGQVVLRNALPEQINSLPAGIYISNGKKYMVR